MAKLDEKEKAKRRLEIYAMERDEFLDSHPNGHIGRICTAETSEELVSQFLLTGDAQPLKSYIDLDPEMMQDPAIVKLFTDFLDKKVSVPSNRPVNTTEIQVDIIESCVYFMFFGLNQSNAAQVVGEKFSKSKNTIEKDYLRPYIKQQSEMMGVSKKELFSDPKYHTPHVRFMAAALSGLNGDKWG